MGTIMSALLADAWAVETRGLTKYYGDRPVVQSLNLKIPAGVCTAFWAAMGPASQPPSKC